MKRLLAVLVLVAVLGGCQSYNDNRGRGDAPIGLYDDSPAYVLNFPDKFANVAFKCLGANGVYTTTREAAPVVVIDDPECDEGAAEDRGGKTPEKEDE